MRTPTTSRCGRNTANSAEYRMWFTLSLFPDYTLERRDSNQASITPDSSDMNTLNVVLHPYNARARFTLQHQQDKCGCRSSCPARTKRRMKHAERTAGKSRTPFYFHARRCITKNLTEVLTLSCMLHDTLEGIETPPCLAVLLPRGEAVKQSPGSTT